MSVIQRIKELHDTAKSGTYYDVENAEYDIVYTELPQLIQEHEALLRFVEDMKGITKWLLGESGDFPDLSKKPHYAFRTELRERFETALTQLDKELKG